MKMVDLARSMAPNLGINIIGIRPGEKMHEVNQRVRLLVTD